MASKTLTLTKIHHPFDRRDRDTLAYKYCGEPLSTIRDSLPAELEFTVSINGRVVPEGHLHLVVPQPGDHIVFCPVPAGGNDGKMIGRVIGLIVVAAVAIMTQQYELVPAFWGMPAAITSMIAGAAIGIIGGVLVGAVFAPRPPGGSSGLTASNAYSWNPQTVQQQGLPMPRWYGTNRLTGNVISTYRSDSSASDQYINALISLGMGPLAITTPANILINNQPYQNFLNDSNGQAVQCQIRQGKLDQTALSGFEAVHTDYTQAVLIAYGTPYVYATVGDVFDSLDVEITFPSGIFSLNSKGGYDSSSVAILVELSPHGANAWRSLADTAVTVDITNDGTADRWSAGIWVDDGNGGLAWCELEIGSSDPSEHLEGDSFVEENTGRSLVWHWLPPTQPTAPTITPGITVTGNSTTAIRQNINSGTLAHGRYDVRITRVDDNNADFVTMYLSNVSEVTNSALTYPRQALVGIQALASSSISGSFQFSMVGDCLLIRVYDGTSWRVAFNKNPAWVLWDVLTQPVFDNELNVLRYDGFDPSVLDLQAFLILAAWLDTPVPDGKGGSEPRMTFNGGFDADATLWDCALQVCQVAGCAIVPTGTGFTLSIEMPADPVQLFSMGNIIQGSFRETFLSLEDRAAEITVDYLDRDQNYNRTQLAVVNGNIPTIANKVNVQCIGVSKASEGWRLANRQLAINELIVRTVEFGADIDAIACSVGDVINFQHDVPQWGYGGRLASATSTTVQLDQEVTLVEGISYSVMVRLSDDTIVSRTVTTAPGTTDLLTVSSPFSTIPAQFDLYAFGISDKVTKPFRVISIKRNGDLQADIITTEYNASIYELDGGSPIVPTINYSALSVFVTVSGLTVSQHALIQEGGALQRNLLVSWSLSGAPALRSEIYIRQAGLPWQQAGSTVDNVFTIQGVQPETAYDVMVVGVNAAGQSTPYSSSPVVSFTTNSTTGAIGSISGIAITGLAVLGGGSVFTGRDCNLVWDAPALPGVIDHYRVKVLAGAAVLRSETVAIPGYVYSYGKNYDDTAGAPLPGFTVSVSAVDIGGGMSAPATLAVSNSLPTAPTALTTSSQLMSVQLAAAYDTPDDFSALEIWSAVANDRSTATIAGSTKTAAFTDAGLSPTIAKYYWARVRDLYGQGGPWYPADARTGVRGAPISDPTTVIQLLNSEINSSALARYLAGDLPFSDLVDTVPPAGGSSVAQVGVFSTKAQMLLDASSDVATALDSIGTINAQLETIQDGSTTAAAAAIAAEASAIQAQNAAAGSASSAQTAADLATAHSADAGNSAAAANTSATNAASSAGAAGESALAASNSATSAQSANAGAGNYASAASTSATSAATYATNAGAGATSAASSATAASTSATSASTYATQASTSAANAASSASSAGTSATTASAAAGTATYQASAATTQAGNAAASATAASTSATAASTQAGNAATSAVNAATSSVSAVTAASSASTYANNASGYATTAATAASTASTAAGTITAQYTIKVDANSRIAGMGLWSDGVTSAVNFLADKFAIVEAGTGKTPVVPFLVQDGVVYINSALIGSLDAGVITSGTLTGRTIQTKADPGTGDRSRMVLDAASNTLILYGADGTPTVVIEGGENAVIDVNTDGLYGLEVSCVDPAVGSNVTLYAIGGGMHGAVLPKYGLAGRGSAGGILISPAASSSSPNGVVSGDIGAVYVTSGGDFYGCKGGSTWVKFG